MNLDRFSKKDDKYERFLKKKDKLIKKMGKLGLLTALETLTPDKLEKVEISFKNREGLRKKVEIFVDTAEELELLSKYFHYNPTTSQIKDIRFLLFILKELDESKAVQNHK